MHTHSYIRNVHNLRYATAVQGYNLKVLNFSTAVLVCIHTHSRTCSRYKDRLVLALLNLETAVLPVTTAVLLTVFHPGACVICTVVLSDSPSKYFILSSDPINGPKKLRTSQLSQSVLNLASRTNGFGKFMEF